MVPLQVVSKPVSFFHFSFLNSTCFIFWVRKLVHSKVKTSFIKLKSHIPHNHPCTNHHRSVTTFFSVFRSLRLCKINLDSGSIHWYSYSNYWSFFKIQSFICSSETVFPPKTYRSSLNIEKFKPGNSLVN